jgi:hypothetical protein
MGVTMTGRYPEDSNIIDFVEIKMLNLYEQYASDGHDDVADACWNALAAYMTGSVDIVFRKGEPYIIERQPGDITDIIDE